MDLKKWQNQLTAKEMVKVLKNKSYDAHFADDINEAYNKVLELIPQGASIGLGGSMTIKAMGILDTLRSENYKLIDRYQPMSWEDEVNTYRKALTSDYFLTGTNAITRSGELINTDSSGNRGSAMVFGPKRVIVVSGVNKIVDNIDEGMKRIKKIAPLNCKRLGHKTPCAESGKCEDCQIQARMCNYTTIIHHGMKFEGRISVIIVAEELGF